MALFIAWLIFSFTALSMVTIVCLFGNKNGDIVLNKKTISFFILVCLLPFVQTLVIGGILGFLIADKFCPKLYKFLDWMEN
jgi:hypothetical protein